MPGRGNGWRDHADHLGVESVDHHHESTERDHENLKTTQPAGVDNLVEIGVCGHFGQNFAPSVIPKVRGAAYAAATAVGAWLTLRG